MENKEFLKFIYKYGEVKDVSEAYEEYPPEEEWHKGKIENVLKGVDKERVDEYIDCFIKCKEGLE